MKVKVSVAQLCLFVTPCTVACHAPLSMEFSRQEYWSCFAISPSRRSSQPRMELRSAALQADSLPSEHQGLWPCFKWFACISHSKQEVLTSCYGRLRIHIICSIPSPFPFLHPPIFVSHTSVCACACVYVICLFLGLFCLEDSSGRRQVRVAACPSSLQGRILMLEALTFSRKITYISSRIVSCPLT